jgi:hypothetical protein
MSKEFILRENVLTDNIVLLSDKNKVFSGGYIAILKEYVYETSWSDKLNVKRFRSKESLCKYLDKKYTQEELEVLDFTDTELSN